jgi:hypothetical protein
MAWERRWPAGAGSPAGGGKKKARVKGRWYGGRWADGVVADSVARTAEDGGGGGGEHVLPSCRLPITRVATVTLVLREKKSWFFSEPRRCYQRCNSINTWDDVERPERQYLLPQRHNGHHP